MKTKNLARIAGLVIPVAALVSGCNFITFGIKGAALDLKAGAGYVAEHINTDEKSNDDVRLVYIGPGANEPHNMVSQEPVVQGGSSPTEEYNIK